MRCAATSPSSASSRRGVRPACAQLLAVLAEVEDGRIPPLARELLQTLATHLRELESKLAALDRRLVALTRTRPPMLPACSARRARYRPGDRHRVRRDGARREGVPLRAPSRRLARPGAQAARQRRQGAASRPEQARRRLSASPADPRRPGAGVAQSWPDDGRLWSWINGLRARRPFNVAVAAVANKLARILWAMLSRGETYRAAA